MSKYVKICQKLGKKLNLSRKSSKFFFGKFFFKIFQNKCQNWPPHGLVMKNDISHAGNMLKCDFPVFTGFCRIFRCKIWKKIFVCPPSNKKNLSWKFQLNLTTYTMKIAIIRFFPDFSGKTGPQIRIFLDRKSPHAKDEANKKKFSQIGPGVPEWEHKPFYGLLWSLSRPPKLLHYMNSLSMRAGWQIEEFKNFCRGGRWR